MVYGVKVITHEERIQNLENSLQKLTKLHNQLATALQFIVTPEQAEVILEKIHPLADDLKNLGLEE